jgi:hypothetical protein
LPIKKPPDRFRSRIGTLAGGGFNSHRWLSLLIKLYHMTYIESVHPKKQEQEVKIIMKNIKNLIANANVVLQTDYGKVTVKGFCIWSSKFIHPRFQEEINITPPSAMRFGRSFPYVFFEDKTMWESLEEKIYNAYCKEKNKTKIENNTHRETLEDDIGF